MASEEGPWFGELLAYALLCLSMSKYRYGVVSSAASFSGYDEFEFIVVNRLFGMSSFHLFLRCSKSVLG
jgi:hypothetical protein